MYILLEWKRLIITLNKIEEFTPNWDEYDYWLDDDDLKETCLTRKQIWNYGKGKNK